MAHAWVANILLSKEESLDKVLYILWLGYTKWIMFENKRVERHFVLHGTVLLLNSLFLMSLLFYNYNNNDDNENSRLLIYII